MKSMSDMININGIFLGKTLVADKEKEYRKYKATFKVDDKDWNFAFFMNWVKDDEFAWLTKNGEPKKGVAPSNLEEGKKYNIGYTEYKTDDMDYAAKTAMSFSEPKQGQDTPTSPTTAATSAPGSLGLNMETVLKLTDVYLKTKKKEDQNVNHYVGTIVRTLLKADRQVGELVELFEKRTTEKKEEPVKEEELVM